MKVLDNSIDTLLSQAGLSASEVVIYQTAAPSGDTSSGLVTRTSMPRATVMAALKALKGYGLCQTHRRDGRSLIYVMQPISNLTASLGYEARRLDELMEKLNSYHAPQATDLSVREARGQLALEEFLELALRCQSRQWQIIGPYQNAIRSMPKSYQTYFKKIRNERQITTQSLWESSAKTDDLPLLDVLMRKPRFVPEDISKEIPSMQLAFDDKLLVVSGTSEPVGILIQSEAVTKTFQLLFELAWRSLKETH